MICPKCSFEVSEETGVCSKCGASLNAKTTEQVTPEVTTELSCPVCPVVPDRRRLRRNLALGFGSFGLVLVVFAFGMYASYMRTTSLYSLVPENAPQVTMVDAPWAWEAIKDVRHQPACLFALGMAEKQLNLSIQDDVMPWIGQVGIVTLDTKPGDPNVAVLVEERDLRALAKCSKNIMKAQTHDGAVKWKDTNYHGIKVRTTQVVAPYGGAPNMTISIATIRRWMIVGVGEGSIEKLVDAWQGRVVSMEKSPAWSKALAQLPQGSVMSSTVDLKAMMKAARDSGAPGMPALKDTSLIDQVAVSSMTEQGGDLRVDTVSVAKSDKMIKLWQAIKKDVKPVSDASLKQLPDGASVVALFSNPGSWVGQYKELIAQFATKDSERSAIKKTFEKIKPAEDIVRRMKGDCAAALVWNQKTGFGLMAVGDMGGQSAATDAAQQLQKFAASSGAQVVKDGGLFKMPPGDMAAPQFKVLPSWTSRGSWIVAGSYPDWVKTAPTSSALKLPDEAKGADTALLMNAHTLVDALISNIPDSQYMPRKEITDAIGKMKLDGAQVCGWSKIAPDGTSQQATLTVHNFEWRKALKVLADTVSKLAMPQQPIQGMGMNNM